MRLLILSDHRPERIPLESLSTVDNFFAGVIVSTTGLVASSTTRTGILNGQSSPPTAVDVNRLASDIAGQWAA